MTPATDPPAGTGDEAVLDETDRRILDELVKDGRASHRDLAARTGISLATVNRRVRQLEADKVVKGYVAVLDADRVGWHLTAIIGLRIDKGFLKPVQREIAKDPRVFGVYDVTGEWDGMVLARTADRNDLDDLIKTTLSQSHIQRTNTMIVLSTVLEEPRVRPAPTKAKRRKAG